MSILVGDNFSYSAAKPLDGRLKYDTLVNMKAVADATMYDGCLAYCTATDKTYQWKSTNTVDETLGKWREFQTGGGGHEILDAEDTALTQREKLKFGNGLTASDNSTDEQTEVEVDVMSSEDMDDVVTPLPSVSARYHKYSTEEQVVGKWIDGSTIYERVIAITTPTVVTEGTSVYKDYALGVPIDKSIRCDVIFETTDGNAVITNDLYGSRSDVTISGTTVSSNSLGFIRAFLRTSRHTNANKLSIGVNASAFSNLSGYAIMQYTKTTD